MQERSAGGHGRPPLRNQAEAYLFYWSEAPKTSAQWQELGLNVPYVFSRTLKVTSEGWEK